MSEIITNNAERSGDTPFDWQELQSTFEAIKWNNEHQDPLRLESPVNMHLLSMLCPDIDIKTVRENIWNSKGRIFRRKTAGCEAMQSSSSASFVQYEHRRAVYVERIRYGGKLWDDKDVIEPSADPIYLSGLSTNIDYHITDDFIEFDSMINIRPCQQNPSRDVLDHLVRKKTQDIITEVVHE